MSDIKVASRYAKSLIDLAVEHNKLDSIYSDMKSFHEVASSNKDFIGLLDSPIIHTDKKQSVIRSSFGSGFDAMSMTFLDTVVRKGRESFLPLIAKEFVRMYNEMKGIATAVITTAVPLDAKSYDELKSKLEAETGKQIEFQTRIDPSIIGGFIIRIGDNLYDASLSNRLRNIKKELYLN